ncbi:MAG: aldehyde ferredoxin oxidoreductase [Firmicutes bacterium]|nr:aldehyde ferredoxin oxidoreductase [Bacillota bacterium]
MEMWLRVDLGKRTVVRQPLPDKYRRLGGRGLTAAILLDEVPPAGDPLGEENKLVLAVGLLGGTAVPASGRLSAGAKSPLTGGIKESNAGGTTAQRLASLGLRAVVVEGRATGTGVKDGLVLEIGSSGGRLVECPDLAGKGIYAASGMLRDRYGARAAQVLIGPAGEMQLHAACIANLDKDGVPSRMCGRGGLGAVMGGKGLKAMVVLPPDTPDSPVNRPARPEEFKQALREFIAMVKDHPVTLTYTRFGTAAMVARTQALGILPTRNFTTGRFEEADRIGGEELASVITRRGGAGATTHACMPGCIVKCSNIYPDESGRPIVSPLEYETIGLMGSNCGIGDLDAIARMNYLANDVGVDTIEVGAALAVTMGAERLRFGDGAGAASAIKEIAEGTGLGQMLGNGAAATAKALGVSRVPVAKGQSFASFDPRGIKGLGVTFATSPQGADHTAGHTIRAEVDHRSPEGQARLSHQAQIKSALYDSLGLCMFVTPPLGTDRSLVTRLINAHYGWTLNDAEVFEMGIQTLAREVTFNRRAGLTSAHDRLPEFLRTERLPSTGTVFDVPQEELDGLVEDFLNKYRQGA